MHVLLEAGNGSCGTPGMHRRLDEVKWDMLREWSKTRRAPRHAAWMHDGTHPQESHP